MTLRQISFIYENNEAEINSAINKNSFEIIKNKHNKQQYQDFHLWSALSQELERDKTD